jgi:hypothetical protein
MPREGSAIVRPMRALVRRGFSAPIELICASRHAAKKINRPDAPLQRSLSPMRTVSQPQI